MVNYDHLRSFSLRAPYLSLCAKGREKLDKIFVAISKSVTIGFGSGRHSVHTGEPRPGGLANGWTHSFRGNVCIWIAIETVTPLLRDDLTVEERLLKQFQVAQTLVHEVAVSFFSLQVNSRVDETS
jgi:hypothetical protein